MNKVSKSKDQAGLILIESKDRKILKVEKDLAITCTLLKDMIEDLGESRLDAEESIPIPFDHKVLSKVIEFMKYEKEVELMPEIEKPV